MVQTFWESWFDTIVPGTIYPFAAKGKKSMDKRRYCACRQDGPARKYFSINESKDEWVSQSFWQLMGRFESKSRKGFKNGRKRWRKNEVLWRNKRFAMLSFLSDEELKSILRSCGQVLILLDFYDEDLSPESRFIWWC